LVLEYAAEGDLRSFLRKHHGPERAAPDEGTQLRFADQVAAQRSTAAPF
jgi:hypothetical protein